MRNTAGGQVVLVGMFYYAWPTPQTNTEFRTLKLSFDLQNTTAIDYNLAALDHEYNYLQVLGRCMTELSNRRNHMGGYLDQNGKVNDNAGHVAQNQAHNISGNSWWPNIHINLEQYPIPWIKGRSNRGGGGGGGLRHGRNIRAAFNKQWQTT